jgi:AraC family transcriptional regulator
LTTVSFSANTRPMVDRTHYLKAVLPYIEAHITEELTPEGIAGQHFISLSQLYRDFYAYTGHSIKEYIRKRRISNACVKIKCSDSPLAVIADESGCQTQQAFHKLFKSIVGMTPLEYRQSDTYFCFYPFTAGDISLAVKVGTEPLPDCIITRFYDSCLVGIEDKALAAQGDTQGRVFGRNGKQAGHQFCYEVMTERAGTAKSAFCATTTVEYNEREINDGWNYLYNSWLAGSMFEDSGEGCFEEYLFQNGKPRRLKLYLPVKKRRTARHIAIERVSETFFLIARERGHNAERKASEKVMSFLQERYPLLLQSVQRFYGCVHDDFCECGVECGGGFKLPPGSGLELLNVPTGRYAVLPDDCLGDIRTGGVQLELFLQNNSIAYESTPVFAVYEALNGKYDNDSIRMKLYKRLNK